jgi:predicted LPLAT superfamily acyltransferase
LVTRYLGLRTASLFLYGIVPYFYLFAPKARRSSQEYWSIVQPELGYFQKQRRVLGHLFKFAQVLLDRLFQSFSRERRFLPNPNGLENIKTAVESKNGIILLTAHVGAWDLASSFLEQDSLSSDFYVVHYSTGQTENATYQKSLLSNGAEQPIFQIRDLLDRGMPIALMGDRPLTRQFELVPFFGKLAPFDVTAFRIAAACQKPLLCTFGFKGKNNQYDFYAEKPQTFKYDSGKNKIVRCYEWTAQFAQVLERYLGQYPDQWFNFFPFWSYLPVSPMGLSTSKEHNYLLEELHKPRKRLPESESDSRPSDERGSLKKDMLKVD